MDKDDMDMMDSLYDEITGLKEDKEKLETALASAKERERVLREAAKGLLDIGKRDMINPKYDGYFESLKAAIERKEE